MMRMDWGERTDQMRKDGGTRMVLQARCGVCSRDRSISMAMRWRHGAEAEELVVFECVADEYKA